MVALRAERRNDETTFNALAPTALLTKNTKLTKAHKESLLSLFDWLLSAGGAALRAVAGVKAGWITSSPE